jgi:hypothetical protein
MLGVMLLLLLLRREWKSICVYMACLMFLFFFCGSMFCTFFSLLDLDDKYPFFPCRGGSLFRKKDCVLFFFCLVLVYM